MGRETFILSPSLGGASWAKVGEAWAALSGESRLPAPFQQAQEALGAPVGWSAGPLLQGSLLPDASLTERLAGEPRPRHREAPGRGMTLSQCIWSLPFGGPQCRGPRPSCCRDRALPTEAGPAPGFQAAGLWGSFLGLHSKAAVSGSFWSPRSQRLGSPWLPAAAECALDARSTCSRSRAVPLRHGAVRAFFFHCRLMGSMALSNHYRSEDLLDIDTAAGGFLQRQGLRQCLPLTFCIHTGLSQYMALESVEGRNKYEIFYQCPDQMARNPSAIDMFITGASYSEWFTSYVHNVVTGGYPIIRDQIFRYVHDKGCVATTGDITVSVSTSFLPELSSVHPPHYFFTYRIRIEMSKDALPEKTCQLDSRYWRITNAKGEIEEVQGPGVVGEFPILSPGRVYEYTSCTTFSTTSGYMEGHYTFHLLYYKDRIFNVAIPRFHMVCPTFKVSTTPRETHNECAVIEEDEESTDSENFEDQPRLLDFSPPTGHCPRHT
ncbi:F-box only protein 3-like [Monodelphis domestica]|uniref:F-box only protein 3-like n=1 Tax=Monodelphis domestica TaxID=13616 RepID=UPI0024E20803|nr:F-box only protein 3-like [Monodelphis domestica]